MYKPWQEIRYYKNIVRVYQWTYNRSIDCLTLELTHKFCFKQKKLNCKTRPYNSTKHNFRSGFMSEGRGVHWDNKSRRGKK